MGKITIFIFGAFLVIALFITNEVDAGAGECPLKSQTHSCNPRCLKDSDCTYGKKCCDDLCHTKSCVEPKALGSSGSGGYKGSGSSGGGTYCNNVKCSPFEKCVMDRATNRMKCGRA